MINFEDIPEIKKESWEFPGYYASTHGYVYSGETRLSPSPDDKGYLKFQIKGKNLRVHRFCVETFIGRKLESEEHVHHKDEDPSNNYFLNLVIEGFKEHRQHHLTPNSKISEEDVKRIANILYTTPITYTEIGRQFGITRVAVSNINKGISWRHLLGDSYEYPIRKS